MSQEKFSIWGVVPFPSILLNDANTHHDCNNSLVFGVTANNIRSYLQIQKCRTSNLVKGIFGPQGKNGSCFNAHKDATNAGLKVYRVKISSLGFKHPATREEIIKRAHRHELAPIDTPRTWAIPLRGWYKEKDKITLFGNVYHGDIGIKTPLELMFTLGHDEKHGDYLSVREAKKNTLFQPDEVIVLENK